MYMTLYISLLYIITDVLDSLEQTAQQRATSLNLLHVFIKESGSLLELDITKVVVLFC